MPPPSSPEPPMPEAAIAELRMGRKIEAIKILRESHGLGLKEAKDRVEAHLAGHPDLQAAFASQQSQRLRSALVWLVAFIALAIATCGYARKG